MLTGSLSTFRQYPFLSSKQSESETGINKKKVKGRWRKETGRETDIIVAYRDSPLFTPAHLCSFCLAAV